MTKLYAKGDKKISFFRQALSSVLCDTKNVPFFRFDDILIAILKLSSHV